MANEAQQMIIEFERNRAQLMTISGQKQQIQLQSATLNDALNELEKTNEKKVYKAIGNILIQSDTSTVKKELAEKKEAVDLRVKSLQKQEDLLVSKLNKLKSQLQGAATAAAGEQTQVLETEKPSKSNESKSKK